MPPKILKSAAEIVKDAIKAVEAEKKAGKTGEILESRTAPATTPRGGTLLPRSQGMYPPDVPQVDLPRQKGVDKARAEGKKPKYTERMQSLLDSPTVRKKVDKLIAKGQDLGMQEWYGTEPLRQVALDVISPQQYESLMAQLASASQRNPVDQQNLMGSYLYYLQQQGKLDPEAVLLTNKLKEQGLEGISAPLIELPEGYGSLAQSAIFERGKQIASGDIAGALPPEKKLGTFYRNLLGNLQPVTVDVNAVRGPVIEAGDPRWLTSKLVEKDEAGKVKNVYFPRQMVEEGEMSIREAKQRPGFWEAAPSGSEYAGFEDLWQRAARREGVAPAEAQALGWYGSADVTALKTKPELYVDNLERLLNRTAEVTGKSPLEVLRQFLKGEEFLKKAKGGPIDLEAEYRMGKGGLLKKAAKAVSEAIEPVLPTAERQANLERFLEGSATKQRLYHGTNKDISTFESGRPVQWLAENPELANQFVAGGRRKMGNKPSKGSVVYPVHAKVKNPLDLTDATPQKAISTVDFLKQAGVDTSPENLRRLAEWDYELTKAYGGGSHLEDPVGSRIERMQYPEPLWSLLDRHMVIKALEDQGYDSVKLTEKFGNKEPYGESQTIGVFNPANIKSATGNVGTYDIGATDITKSKGGVIKSLAKAIAKELPEAKASQRTQIPGTEPTYRKAYDILEREMPGGRTLDYGAGLGHGSRLMGAESFEPFPREGFKPDFIRPEDIPTEEFDRLVNLNVLNVMPREVRDATVENIGRVMRPGGMGIVTTRGRDVLNAAGEAGPEPMSKITSIGTYQKGFLPEELRQYLEYILGRDYSVSKLGLGPAGAVVRKKGKAEGGEIKRADGGAIGKNVGRGMAGLTRSRQPLDPKEIQAMMLDVPAGVGIPFAEAGAEYLRGNIEDAKTSAAIDAALTAVPVAGALAKPAYRAVKKGVQKAAPAVREAARGALESGMESGAIVDPRMQAIAYHGSPHKFEKFDPSKIGTGEGAQAYGHGLYFAESPEIATGYRNRLAKGTIPVVDALPAEAGKNIPESAYSFIRGYEDVDAAIQGLRETTQNVPDFIKKAWSHNPKGLEKLHKDYLKSADWLEKNKDRIQIIQDRGHLYTVDIPDESVARMLDWDKPLEKQPAIRELLRGTDYEVGVTAKEAEKIADERLRQEAYDWADETGGDPVDYINNANWEKYVDDVMQESGKVHGSTTGEELHKIIMRDQGYRKELFDPYNYQVDTSETLRGLGIPGIKYLDATSRSAGEGTRNFVVFPGEEETVKILERKKRGGAVIMKSGGKVKSAADMFHAKGHQALMDFDNKTKKRKG